MARGSLMRVAGVTYVGGLYFMDSLRKHMHAEGRMVLDLGELPPVEFTKLVSTVRHGFTTSYGSTAMAILKALESWPAAPRIHEIGYMGKRELRVLVARQNAAQYQTDLIAAGHMLDVDLSAAARLGGYDNTGTLQWLNVDSYNIGMKAAPVVGATYSARRAIRAGMQLKPATSKLASLVKSWTLETYHMRAPLVDWINTKPTLEWSLSSKPG